MLLPYKNTQIKLIFNKYLEKYKTRDTFAGTVSI